MQDRVKKFLLMLASAEDVSLQLLSVRLDFNEYYKSKDSRLVVPLTYQHRRQSDQTFFGCKWQLAAENLLEDLSDPSHISNKHYTQTAQNSSDLNSKDKSMFDLSNNHPSSFCSLHRQHDTTNFFYRLQSSSNTMTDLDDSVALHKRRCRTNLKNAELSKHIFRIFLEKQILSHVGIEIQKNIHEVQSPLTPNFDYTESNFNLSYARLAFLPFHTAVSQEKSSVKNNLSLPNLEADTCSSDRAVKIANTIVHHDTKSGINVYSLQSKSKASTYTALASNQNTSNPKINKVTNTESSRTMIHNNSPEWFQDNETASVHGSLLSEAISDTSVYNANIRSNINPRRCRWKRILFCCVNWIWYSYTVDRKNTFEIFFYIYKKFQYAKFHDHEKNEII